TATSGGMVFIPGNAPGGRGGTRDSIEDARRYLRAELAEHADLPLLEAFLEAGTAAVDYLEARTEVKFEAPRPNPDYHPGPGASAAGRTILPVAFDGRRLGADFDLVRPPREELM